MLLGECYILFVMCEFFGLFLDTGYVGYFVIHEEVILWTEVMWHYGAHVVFIIQTTVRSGLCVT